VIRSAPAALGARFLLRSRRHGGTLMDTDFAILAVIGVVAALLVFVLLLGS